MATHTAHTKLQLIGKLILSGDLHCETGLHIGAGKGSLEIGGADNPVVKDAFGLPYIPGSSLRGKIRSLLENALGLTSPAELVYLSKRKGQEVRIHQDSNPIADFVYPRLGSLYEFLLMSSFIPFLVYFLERNTPARQLQ